MLWPTQMVPHLPPLYPVLVHALELMFGMSRTMVYILLVIQHVFLFGAIVYLASAFKKPIYAFLISIFAIAGT